jgi:LPS sulfotransferase NodH
MNWKLLAGRLRDAWLDYPAARQRIAAVPAGPPIFLTGTHRSGTTWLAGMLAASGICYSHEPTAPKKGRWSQNLEYRASGIVDPNLDTLFEDVLAGGFRAALRLPNSDHPLMPLRLLRPRFRRVLIKDPLACLMSAYLSKRFQMQTLILFRHPAGFVSSVCRLGWPRGQFLRQFLADDVLMAAHLEQHRALLERYAGEDSIASATVLHAALNTVLWDFAQAGVGTALSFEALCADPINQLEHLFGTLGLPYNDGVRAAHSTACLGKEQAIGAYHPHAINRNSIAMASAWKVQLSKDEVAEVRGLWEQFDVPLYRDVADWTLQPASEPVATSG